MGSFSIWHWMIVLAVALLLFGGKGKISGLMGDVAQGVKAFKKGLADDENVPAKPVENAPVNPVETVAAKPVETPRELSADAPLTSAPAAAKTDDAAKH